LQLGLQRVDKRAERTVVDLAASRGPGSGNSHNGRYPKTVTTDIGKVELRVPRDRNASVQPVTVRKGQRPSTASRGM
jgi:transposase-like protein